MRVGRPPVKTRIPYLTATDVEREPNGRRSRKVADASRPVVYFIGSGHDGQIKVGYTARPLDRLADLQPSNPEPLRMLGEVRCASVEDARKLERVLHALLAARGRHIRGEWFRLTVNEIDKIEVALGLKVRKPENARDAYYGRALPVL